MMQKAPKSLRVHIGVFGRRNVGKSSVLNALTAQNVSIVSEIAGTTTDPVEKPMELLPIGPVLFIDTAGVDDTGALGTLRIERSRQTLDRVDIGVIVCGDNVWTTYEQDLQNELTRRGAPVIAVFNKQDHAAVDDDVCVRTGLPPERIVRTCAHTGAGMELLRKALFAAAPDDLINRPGIASDLVGPGECAVLVVPIDKEAPKGRLILPQVQTIRDLLDHDSFCLVVKERELSAALKEMRRPPRLVVTDSQAFLKVAADTPPDVPLTGFSILFARFQGDLVELVRGACAIDDLTTGDKVLVAEACTHHPIDEDIGTVKIPRWLTGYVGGKLEFTNVRGHDFPQDLSPYKLVIHCGACMWNRREMLNRTMKCREAGVPITNYGLTIAYSLGIFERALGPFPAARDAYLSHRNRQAEQGTR